MLNEETGHWEYETKLWSPSQGGYLTSIQCIDPGEVPLSADWHVGCRCLICGSRRKPICGRCVECGYKWRFCPISGLRNYYTELDYRISESP